MAQSCGPLPCTEALVELPYQLDFSSDHGEILDGNGVGTGFRYVDPTTNGTGYIPANLLMDTAAGELQLTTTSGLAIRTTNSQDNTIGVGIDAPSQVTRIETTLSDPPDGTGHNEQAGLWFGNDEDNYLKLVYTSSSSGTRIQFLMEVGGVIAQQVQSPFLDLSGHTVTLSMIADPVNRRVDASYEIDNAGPVSLSPITAPGEFFSFDAAQIDPTIGTDTFGGIFASHRGGSTLAYRFNEFSVVKERDATGSPADLSSEGIAFEKTSFPVPMPTAMALGPDGRLYVSELLGSIHALTLDEENQVVDDEVISTLGSRLTLGLSVDPSSTPDDVILIVSHSDPSLDNGTPNSSIVSRLSGPGFASRDDVITGLPRAIANHGTNATHFGPDGRLYIAQGGNTGAGAPNEIPGSEFGDRAEQPLSAALLVADINDPGFDGSCSNESDIFGPPPCDVETYATGLRNTYDFVFHSNGEIYAPDNSVGTDSTFPPSPTAPCLGLADPAQWDANPPGDAPDPLPDPLNRLVEGKYYGHPNPYRDECVFYDGRFQDASPPPSYKPPIYELGSHRSANGTIEYTSDAACGSLKGDLLIANYGIGDDITRVRLSPDGQSVLGAESLIGAFNEPLPLVQAADGTVYVGEFGADKVTALTPLNIGCWTDRAPLPAELLDAGGAALDGKLYVVAGEADQGHVSSLYVFDPAHNTWASGPALPGPAVENPAVIADGGRLYAFGGSTQSFSGAVTNAASFDPATNAWTALPPLLTPRGQATAAAIGGKIYLVGGLDSAGASLAGIDVFDPSAGPSGTWSSVAPMSTRRADARSAVLDRNLYVLGGGTRDADGTWVDRTLDSVEMYDPGTDTWVGRAPMPTGRQSMAVGTLNGRAQVMGGELSPTGPGTFPENEEYDPATDSWRTVAAMPTPRHGAVAGTIGEAVYIVGGGSEGLSSFSNFNQAFSFSPLPPPQPPPPPPPGPAPAAKRCLGKRATIVGEAGPDKLRGTAGADVIVGLGGGDRIRGARGADRICGGRGEDVLRGGAGRDRLLGGPGADRLLGGGALDFCIRTRGRDQSFSCEQRGS